MRKFTLLLLGLIGLIIISFLCLNIHKDDIERDLATRTAGELTRADIRNATVSLDGRDVTLNGAVASREVVDRAAGIAGNVYGVRTVINQLTVAVPPAPAVPEETAATPVKPQNVQVAINKLLEGKTIEFAFGSDEILDSSFPILNSISAILSKNKDARVEIAGHTDSEGNAAYNRDLSQRRAAAVRRYLINRGIAAQQLTARGYGPDKPLVANTTREGRQKNRRVEFNIQ